MLKLLDKEAIVRIHETIIANNGGFNIESYNTDKLEGVIGRIQNTIIYSDEPLDPFDLAALYAEAFARGHAFPDGNKRTAFICAVTSLTINLPKELEELKLTKQLTSNVDALQSASFMTEFMVLVAEGKLTQYQTKQMFMKLFAGTMLVIGVGYGIYKLIDFLVNKFSAD